MSDLRDEMILVDMNDREIGSASKEKAHADGLLHRAFSVFLFSPDGERLLLQRRALDKYHCGGLWTNTCCSHPRRGETVIDAGLRRLREEMGIEAAELKEAGSFVYRSSFSNGVTEFEFDHILIGCFEGDPVIDTDEAAEARWAELADIRKDIIANPESYTPWFITAFSLLNRTVLDGAMNSEK